MKLPGEYQKMTIAQLKKELLDRGCDIKGCKLKAQYQERLALALASDGEQPPAQEEKIETPQKETPFKPFTPMKKKAETPKKTPKSSKQQQETPSSSGNSFSKCGSLLVLLLAVVIGAIVFMTNNEDFDGSYAKVEKLFQLSKNTLTSFHLANALVSLEVVKRMAEEVAQKFATATGSSCEPFLPEPLLGSIVFNNPVWRNWAMELHRAIHMPADENEPQKATAILLARNTSYGGSVYDTIVKSENFQCSKCVMNFSGKNYSTAATDAPSSAEVRGKIQKELAQFLRKCPAGIVIIENLEMFDFDTLAPFHNAMSEQGGVTDNGKTIPGWNAMYIITMNVDMQQGFTENPDLAGKMVKARLEEHTNSAFRRRIDYVGLGMI